MTTETHPLEGFEVVAIDDPEFEALMQEAAHDEAVQAMANWTETWETKLASLKLQYPDADLAFLEAQAAAHVKETYKLTGFTAEDAKKFLAAYPPIKVVTVPDHADAQPGYPY